MVGIIEEGIPVTYVVYNTKNGKIIQYVEADLKEFKANPEFEKNVLKWVGDMTGSRETEMSVLAIRSDTRIRGHLYKMDIDKKSLIKLSSDTKQKGRMIL
jgi:hypothetical protein